MLLVSSCPAGHISNFFTHRARGNAALSVSISTLSTLGAIVATPLNVAFWAAQDEPMRGLLRSFSLDPLHMLGDVAMLLGVPLAAGSAISQRWPALAKTRASRRCARSRWACSWPSSSARWRSTGASSRSGAATSSRSCCCTTLALAGGYGVARAAGLPERDRRAVAFETGIQNSGWAWCWYSTSSTAWAAWPSSPPGGASGNIVAGLTLSSFWMRRDPLAAPSKGHAMSGARVLVTGGNGYLGHQVVAALAGLAGEVETVVSLDLRAAPPERSVPGVLQACADIRDAGLAALLRAHRIDTVVHLAAIVTPGRHRPRTMSSSTRSTAGTRNVLQACVDAGVKRLVVSSSGAAYGYHADNPAWLSEDAPLRGNEEFAYSRHKRLVEEMLAEARRTHRRWSRWCCASAPSWARRWPTRSLRCSTRRGRWRWRARTALRLRVGPGRGGRHRAGRTRRAGRRLKRGRRRRADDPPDRRAHGQKRCRVLPPALLSAALWLGRRLGLTQYGPEQLRFLQYRPVLDNRRLKEVFGYRPRKTSAEAFDVWWTARQRRVNHERGTARLRGRVVVVTGAAGGLGAALARQCAEAGARVSRSTSTAGAEAIAVGLRAQDHDTIGLACDVSDEAACHSAIADVVQRLGGIDWLIANAGISARCPPAREAAPAVLRRVMAVNFFGAAWCTQAALPSLLQRRGQIVVISSVAGFSPLVGRSAYAASKHALHGFFDSLRSGSRPTAWA